MASEQTTDWALHYRQQGLSCIPANSVRKKGPPFAWKEYQERRPTESELREWWQRWPDYGIAIITGAISGVVVLDLDRHKSDGVEVARSVYGWEPEGPVVLTGGGGIHAYYRHPGFKVKNLTGRDAIAPGVELKGDGGFVYAPPSLHPAGKRYEWQDPPWEVELPALPDWVLEKLPGEPAKREVPQDQLDAADLLQLALLQGVAEGERNDTAARLAGRYLTMGLAEHEVLVMLQAWNQRNRPPLTGGELQKVVRSISRREQLKRGVDLQLSDDEDRRNILDAISEVFGVPIDEIYWVTGTDPVMRFVCGGHEVNIPAKRVRSQATWNRELYAATGRVPRILGPRADPGWDYYLQQMTDLARANTIEGGEEATLIGQVKQWLSAYLEENPPAREGDNPATPEGPVTVGGRVWINLPAFRRAAKLDFDADLKPRELAQYLRAWGFETERKHVTYGANRHAQRRFWAIPVGFLEEDGEDGANGCPF